MIIGKSYSSSYNKRFSNVLNAGKAAVVTLISVSALIANIDVSIASDAQLCSAAASSSKGTVEQRHRELAAA